MNNRETNEGYNLSCEELKRLQDVQKELINSVPFFLSFPYPQRYPSVSLKSGIRDIFRGMMTRILDFLERSMRNSERHVRQT